jgi:predicted  nucleic acid-binding Zn-ribbon protein
VRKVTFLFELEMVFVSPPDSALPRQYPEIDLGRKELASLKESRETALVEVRAAENTLDCLTAKAAAAKSDVDDAKKRLETYTENLKTIEQRMIELLLEHDWTL